MLTKAGKCVCMFVVRRITRINFKLYNNDVFIFNDGNCIHDRVHWHWCSCRNVHERSHGVRYRVRDANALERLLGLVGQCALERAWCGRLGMVLAPDNIDLYHEFNGDDESSCRIAPKF